MYLSSPISASDFSDEPPPYIFGGGGVMTCKEQPAIRRILGATGKPGGGLRRHHRRTTPHQRNGRQPRRWEDDGGRALAADSHVLLPSDRRQDSPITTTTRDSSRRMPQLVRQEAFCASSTSRDWRSLDYVDDDDELYRLGLLYDESRDHRESLSRSIMFATHATTGACNEDEVIHSARFSLDTISHEEPAYTVRIMPASAQRRRRRPGYRYDHHPASAARTDCCDGEDEVMSDDSDEEHPRHHHHKSVRFQDAPALTLDLSFTAFADHVHQAWPHHHRARDGPPHYQYHDSHAQILQDDAIHQVTSSSQPMQHIIYEIDETDEIHDDDDDQYRQTGIISRTTCPGTPITQTPELVSDDEDIASDDAEWFSLMEDGWTPIEEDVISLGGTDGKELGTPGGLAISETWVVLGGRGQDYSK